MPETTGESPFFTAITAWMMVCVMTLYHTVLAMGSVRYAESFSKILHHRGHSMV